MLSDNLAVRSDQTQVSPSLNVSDWDSLFHKYELFLRGQRGLSENTSRIYLSDVDSFRRYLGQEGRSLTQMDRQVLRGYLAWLATSARDGKEGYARVSIARKLTALRSFYRFLVQEGLFRSNPVPAGRAFQMKVEKPLPIFLGQHETGRLLDTPDESNVMGVRDKAILEVLYSCGTRLAEIQGTDLPDLDLPKRQILVRGKGSKERWVLFGKPAEAALRRYLQESRPKLATGSTPALFLNRYGQRLSRRSIEMLVRRYAARAGLRDGVHPHTLRHTFASHMLEGNADLRVIQELLGHSSPTTTQIYTHITKQEARHAYLHCHPRAADPSSQE
jgi:integrase/recombinase XerC